MRRCARRLRPLAPGGLRPTDLLAAFFLTAIAFLLSGVVVAGLGAAGVLGWYAHWLALHLLFLGGVSLLVLGAGQFFCTAFLATDPPRRRMVHAQLATWTAGTVLVAVGVPTGISALTDLGGLAAAAVAALALSRLPGLGELDAPAAIAVLAAGAPIGGRILVLAARAVGAPERRRQRTARISPEMP